MLRYSVQPPCTHHKIEDVPLVLDESVALRDLPHRQLEQEAGEDDDCDDHRDLAAWQTRGFNIYYGQR